MQDRSSIGPVIHMRAWVLGYSGECIGHLLQRGIEALGTFANNYLVVAPNSTLGPILLRGIE